MPHSQTSGRPEEERPARSEAQPPRTRQGCSAELSRKPSDAHTRRGLSRAVVRVPLATVAGKSQISLSHVISKFSAIVPPRHPGPVTVFSDEPEGACTELI